MIGDLFDSPWKVLILAVVILVLFGSRKLPDAARSLGRSMRILKSEIHDLHDGDEEAGMPAQHAAVSAAPTVTNPPMAVPEAAPVTHQQQVDQLQQQIDELRRQATATDPQAR
jgi:sec-independent protein translocase protein TatA